MIKGALSYTLFAIIYIQFRRRRLIRYSYTVAESRRVLSTLNALFPRFFVCLVLLFACNTPSVRAQDTQCSFDYRSLGYAGKPQEQAKCLLRPVLVNGHLGAALGSLPPPFDKLIGKPLTVDRDALRRYLTQRKISEADIGGSLSDPVSPANLIDPDAQLARYFVIHDVSTPNYLNEPFPSDFNEPIWIWNDLVRKWITKKVTHVFINRTGESATAVDFKSALPDPNHGTKFARDHLRNTGKGLYLHIELVQPRRSDPRGNPGNDAISPVPGFTDSQLERLALVYIAASVRRGEWLIPAFHAAIDVGIPNAHDDPQNFDTAHWADKVGGLLKAIKVMRIKSPRRYQ